MNIYPAIDIRGGHCVRLEQGKADQQTEYFEDPVDAALRWKHAGAQWVHVVDLDGAFEGKPANLPSIRRIVETGLDVQLGGGMREFSQVQSALQAGVKRIVIGTRACQEPEFASELIEAFGVSRIAVGIDARNGKVAIKGWVETSQRDALDLAREIEQKGVKYLIYTDISRDGMLSGPNTEAYRTMLTHCGLRLIASGGISTMNDIEDLASLRDDHPHFDGIITGKALYEKRIQLEKLIQQYGTDSA